MRVYSAGEAIGPAWQHTKALLWQNKRWKRFLKICLVAFGAEVGGGLNGNFSGFGNHGNANLPPALVAMLVSFALVIGIVSLIVGLALLYLASRLQFVLFDIVLLRDDRVAPAWRRHGGHTWRWIEVKITAAIGIAVLLSPLLIAAIPAIIALIHSATLNQTPGATPQFNFAALRTLFLLFAEVVLLVIAYVAVLRFFTALALPGLALEDLSFGNTFQRAWQIFRSDIPAMLLFLLLEPLLLMVLGIGGLLCIVIATFIAAIPFAIVGGLLWLLVHKTTVGALVLLGLFAGLAALVLLVWFLLCELAVIGSLYTFARAWSLYFIGGRYPMLGQYLEPTVAVPVWTPPPSLPRDEDDDRNGPDLPTNPALA